MSYRFLTQEEANSEARRRWGPTSFARQDHPYSWYAVGYTKETPDKFLWWTFTKRQDLCCGQGSNWEAAFDDADAHENLLRQKTDLRERQARQILNNLGIK